MLMYLRVHYREFAVVPCMLCFILLLIVCGLAAPADVLFGICIEKAVPQTWIFGNAGILFADAAVDAGGKDGELLHLFSYGLSVISYELMHAGLTSVVLPITPFDE